jgi:hypothetical protein
MTVSGNLSYFKMERGPNSEMLFKISFFKTVDGAKFIS